MTGPNVFWERPGAVLDVALEADEREAAVETWRSVARDLLDAVGWGTEELCLREHPGGASLVISAPVDALYAATEVNEVAWAETERRLHGDRPASAAELAQPLRETIEAEGLPGLLELQRAAIEHGVAFLSDDERASVGSGGGGRSWPLSELPSADAVDWESVRDVPTALVTGTNGKTTTVRLLASIVEAAGRRPGTSSTDWLKVGDELLDEGDWSGPGGARAILRDRRVEVALLETARGGMLRRGLGVRKADVAAILNVAEDHLGEWGIEDLAALVETKFVVARAARHLVLNAEDAEIVHRARGVELPITWFGVDLEAGFTRRAAAAGCEILTLAAGWVVRTTGDSERPLLAIDEIPIALGGAARHNVANALAAIGVAERLGIDDASIRRGLARFDSDPSTNPGRLNRFDLGGARVLVDFAHNPHGLEAILEMAAALPAARRLVLVGQAGDRTDESIRDLGRLVWSARPDRVVVKEMPDHLRGRGAGVVPRLIAEELERAGAPADAVDHASSELDGVRRSLEWAREGDLLLILSHESRTEVLRLLGELEARGWTPGSSLPEVGAHRAGAGET